MRWGERFWKDFLLLIADLKYLSGASKIVSSPIRREHTYAHARLGANNYSTKPMGFDKIPDLVSDQLPHRLTLATGHIVFTVCNVDVEPF